MKTIFAIIALLAACLHLSAHDADSTSLRPTFGADLTREVQTDFDIERGTISSGMKVMVSGFGVGLSWGGTMLYF